MERYGGENMVSCKTLAQRRGGQGTLEPHSGGGRQWQREADGAAQPNLDRREVRFAPGVYRIALRRAAAAFPQSLGNE